MDRDGNNILLVEDEAIIAMGQKMQLERYGYSVKTAISGQRAIEDVASDPDIDLILMDIDLGSGLDGTQVAEIVLAQRDIPVVFLSSHTEREVVEKTEKITSYGYVVKSSSITVLDASIKMAFKLFAEKQRSQAREEALKRAEERILLINNSSPDSIYSYDNQGRFTSANKSLCDLLGLEESMIIGHTHAELGFPPELCREWDELHDLVRQTDSTVESESTAPVKEGTIHNFMVTLNPLHGEHGSIIGIGGTTRDITERKKLELALQEKNEEYQVINEELRSTTEELQVQNEELQLSQELLRQSESRLLQAELYARIGHWTLDLNTGTMIASEGADAIYGVDFKRIPLAEVQKIPLPEYRPMLDKALSDLITRDATYDLNFKIRRPNDGAIIDIHSVATLDKKTNTVFGVIQDISAQKITEALLLKSNILFRAIIESSPDIIIFALDSDYRYLAFNSRHRETIKKIWGKEIEIGTCMLDVIGEHDDRIKAKINFDRALSGESFVLVEDYGNEALARHRWLDYWSPMKDSAGTIIGLTCILIDNSEKRQLSMSR